MKFRSKAKMWGVISITLVIVSFLAGSILLLEAGEKRIRYELPHRFAVEDPQFLRTVGQLLGPGILPGNRITALQNGDQIFPAMLAAIRSARETITFPLPAAAPGTPKGFSQTDLERYIQTADFRATPCFGTLQQAVAACWGRRHRRA